MKWGMGVLLATTTVHAEVLADAATRLSFVRAENASDCIAAPALEQEVRRRMGRDPFTAEPRQWIEGYVAKQGAFYEVQLFERDAQGNLLGTRRLRDGSGNCHELDEAIVLAIALIIDPTAKLAPAQRNVASNGDGQGSEVVASSRAPATAPSADLAQSHRRSSTAVRTDVIEPEATALTPTAPRTTSARAVADATNPEVATAKPSNDIRGHAAPTISSRSKRGTAFVALDAVLLNGAFPRLAFGAELTAKLLLDDDARYGLRIGAMYLPEQRDHGSNGEIAYGLSALEVAFCLQTASLLTWHGCGGVGLGAIHTVVHDPAPFEPGDRLWADLRLEAGAAAQLVGPIWLNARAFGMVLPHRWEFRVRNDGAAPERAFLQSYFVPGVAVGAALHFE